MCQGDFAAAATSENRLLISIILYILPDPYKNVADLDEQVNFRPRFSGETDGKSQKQVDI